ncbi:nucleoside recognition domain-containing protein [Aestuariirhabdus sp. LZHN29]|uniref:nucleoside recognition domain-containing protein n=1 Tax=Aestuariirhabdus sp. LZHN29 TaxID=3417462 RepID=UPI003CF764F0
MKPIDFDTLPPQLWEHCRDIARVYWVLVKVMLPAILLVKLLDSFGATEWLGWLLAPVMEWVGLPANMGLVWAAAILTNLYTAMVVFYELAGSEHLSVAQVSVLGILVLVAHSLPTEGAVAKMVGVRWRITLVLRIGGALLLAAVVHRVYAWGQWQQQEAQMLWSPTLSEQGLMAWGLDQLRLFATIFVIISALMSLLRVLRWLGIERLMHWLLSPLLRVLQVGREATNVTIIGITLGLSFGAGLLVAEARTGQISKRDMVLTTCFLGLAHSLIEDTLLIMLLGADPYAILWGRLAFAIVVMAIIARAWRRTASAPTLSANAETEKPGLQ